MLDQLFELGLRATASGKSAWALKNLIFALLVTRHGTELRYDWESPGESLDEINEGGKYCLRMKADPGRVLKMPAHRTTGVLSAFMMRKVLREPDGGQIWAPPRRKAFLDYIVNILRPSSEATDESDDPEISRLWRELVKLVGQKEIITVLRWLNLNRLMLEEIRKYVPRACAA